MRIAARALLATAVAAALVVVSPSTIAAEKSKEEAKSTKAGQINRDFEAFVKNPSKEQYLRVYRAVTTSKDYEPYGMELRDVDDLLVGQKFTEADARLKKAMPTLVLCPRAHAMASRIARALGDKTTAEKEAKLAEKCIEGILSTGEGSAESPYLVTRVSDEYDVLRHLKKTLGQQGVLRQDGKTLDKIECEGGDEVYFDVTALFKSMS